MPMKHACVPLALTLALAGCVTIEQPDSSNLAAYCTAQNAERLGAAGRAYFGVCPKASEAAFLAALERGRALAWTPTVEPYYQQMHQLEARLVAATSDADRERLRRELRGVESWTMRLLNYPGTYKL